MRARVALYRDPAFNPAAAAARQQAAMADTGAGWGLGGSSRLGRSRAARVWGKVGTPPRWHPPPLPASCLGLAFTLCPLLTLFSLGSPPHPADDEDGDVPEVPLEELLDDLAALELGGGRGWEDGIWGGVPAVGLVGRSSAVAAGAVAAGAPKRQQSVASRAQCRTPVLDLPCCFINILVRRR